MECLVTKISNPGYFYAQTGNTKKFEDFEQLMKLIQGYCKNRDTHFHSVSNICVDEILFVRSVERNGLYVRAKVLQSAQESCNVLLIDYGDVEYTISSVLKIDPSVQKFAEIPSFADKYSLAFIRPTGGVWSDEATQTFRDLCTEKLIYLPTEEPNFITLIERPKNHSSIRDISVVLIQAGYAERVLGVTDDGMPSIAASISDLSQQLHTVAVQTEPSQVNTTGTSPSTTLHHTTSATSPIPTSRLVKPPPGFDSLNGGGDGNEVPAAVGKKLQDKKSSGERSAKQKATSGGVYVPPALRTASNEKTNKYSSFILNHDAICVCVICSIKNLMEMTDMTDKERSETILSTSWPKLSTREEAILRCSITGSKLSTENREMLLDIMLGLFQQQWEQFGNTPTPRRISLDSATQVTSTSTKLTLSSYDNTQSQVADEISIMRRSSEHPIAEPTDTVKVKALSPAYTAESDVKNTRLADYDPDNWSDPEDNFLSDSSSEPDIILERTSSVSTVVSSATLRDSKYQQQQPQHHHNGDQRRQLYQDESYNNSSGSTPDSPYAGSRDNPNMGATFITNYNTNQQRSAILDSPKLFCTEPEAGIGSMSTPPLRSAGRGRGESPRRTPTKVMSYGLGLSATRRSNDPNKPRYNFHQADLDPPASSCAAAQDNNGLGGFGTIMYCTFCGSTIHRSADCPEGTKNLFLHNK